MIILQLLLFCLAATASFTLPGLFMLNLIKTPRSFFEKITLSTVVGFVIFTLLSYLFKLIHLPWLIIPSTLLFILLFLKTAPFRQERICLPNFKKVVILGLIFLLGVAGQIAIIAPSGSWQNGNLVFWSALGHDGIWHIALIEELKREFPLQNPVLAGERLVNYHFFSDIASADFSRYLNFPALDLHFRFFPVFFSLLLGALAFTLGRKLGQTFAAGVWAMIFTYFAGSFGFIVTWLQSKTVGGESLFWATQIQSSSGNPPQIAAFIVLLAFLILLLDFMHTKNRLVFFLCALLAGSLAVLKVYAGVVTLGSLFLVSLIYFLLQKKIELGLMSILALALTMFLYLPNTANTDQFLIWEPWWFIRTMIVAPDRLNLLDWEMKRQTYFAEGNFKRVIQWEAIGFIIFFLGNLGMRFLGLAYLPQLIKKLPNNFFHQLLILISLSSLILPLVFLQKGVAPNMIQFMQYLLLLFGICAGVVVSQLLSKIRYPGIQLVLSTLIILLAVPTQIGLLYSFYNRPPFAQVSSEEMTALNFLKKHTSETSIILTPSYQKDLNLSRPISDIWDWSDTAYVSALSQRKTYLADTEQVEIMGYRYQDRVAIQKTIFTTEDPKIFEQTLKQTSTQYLYFPKPQAPKVDLEKTNLKLKFSNSLVEIWQIP